MDLTYGGPNLSNPQELTPKILHVFKENCTKSEQITPGPLVEFMWNDTIFKFCVDGDLLKAKI